MPRLMESRRSHRLVSYLGLAGLGLLAAPVLGRLEPALLSLPFLLMLMAGLLTVRRPSIEADVSLDRERVLEGEEVTLRLRLRSPSRVPRLTIVPVLPEAIRWIPGQGQEGVHMEAMTIDLHPGERTFEISLICRTWGSFVPGRLRLQVRDLFGIFSLHLEVGNEIPLRVYPRPETLRKLVPAVARSLAGNEVSRQRGEGIEFADIRPFQPGDQIRRINWRVSARQGELHVNELHPERNLDVVILLDSFSNAGTTGASTLDVAVRGAASLARHYLERRDQVGLIGFGGTLRWLEAGPGERQLYRIVETLLDTEVTLSFSWIGMRGIPARILPTGALVIALTPLLEERVVTSLVDLQRRGTDLAVVEISPLEMVAVEKTDRAQLAYRLWLLQREATRLRLRSFGIPVACWNLNQPLQGPLEEMRAFKRQTRSLHA